MLGIFLDSETNGLNAYVHKIIEIALQIVDMETGIVISSYDSIIQQSYEDWQKSDPESLRINGFDWEEISYGKSPLTVAEEIQSCLAKEKIHRDSAVFICQNPSFDRAFFSQLISAEIQEKKQWPYHWLDLASMHWALALYKKQEGKSLPFPWEVGLSKNKIAKYFSIPEEAKPHKAMNGVRHLFSCYEALVGFPSKAQ